MEDLHAQIMNIPASPGMHTMTDITLSAYLDGHCDARHAAAELASAEIERNRVAIAELVEALILILPMAKGYASANRVGNNDEHINAARAAIAKHDTSTKKEQ